MHTTRALSKGKRNQLKQSTSNIKKVEAAKKEEDKRLYKKVKRKRRG